jgi:mitosis inhibitor protein kinase SWE1
LDLKPSNVFIDFEGVLKIGDFGLAHSWPARKNIDHEGDKHYIAQEVLDGEYDKPADIFALGLIIAEIAGNVELPQGGASWHHLRAGSLCDFPSLTFSSDSDLPRNESGDPITPRSNIFDDEFDSDHESAASRPQPVHRPDELVTPPRFMLDPEDYQALDTVCTRMIAKPASARPTIEEVYRLDGVQWVETRRRSGATIYEGVWGPADHVLHHGEDGQDVDMTDV